MLASDSLCPELLLIAAMAAFVASVIGGVAGYGTGALMPLVLVPIVGAEPVVPIIAISALFTNTSRAPRSATLIDWRRALIILAAAIPTTMLGAWGYTKLTGRGAMLVIGTMMTLSVPLRRLSKRHGLTLSESGLGIASVFWGVVVGGTSGRRHHPAVDADGGRARRRRRDRDRRGDLGRSSASSRSACSACSAR